MAKYSPHIEQILYKNEIRFTTKTHYVAPRVICQVIAKGMVFLKSKNSGISPYLKMQITHRLHIINL